MVADAQRRHRIRGGASGGGATMPTMAYQVERQLHESGDRVPLHEKARAGL